MKTSLKLFNSLFLCLAFISSPSFADDAVKKGVSSKKIKAVAVTTSTAKEQNAVLDSLAGLLSDCHNKYLSDMDMLNMQFELAYAKKELQYNRSPSRADIMEIRLNLIHDQDLAGWPYKQCVTTVKETFNANSTDVLKEIKDANTKTKFREVLAQWLTVIDTVDKDTYDQEFGKFKTLKNNYALEYPPL